MMKVETNIKLGPDATPADAKQALVEAYRALSVGDAGPLRKDHCDLFISAVRLIAADTATLMPDVGGSGRFVVRTPCLLHALDFFSNRLQFSDAQRPQAYEALLGLYFDTDVLGWGTIGMSDKNEAARGVILAIQNMRRNAHSSQSGAADLTRESLS